MIQLVRLWLLNDDKELGNREKNNKKNNIWKIVRLHVAIKCNAMDVFKMNLADFFGEKTCTGKKWLNDGSILFLPFSHLQQRSHKRTPAISRLFHFTFVDSFACEPMSWSWCWSWRSSSNESIITGFYLVHPLPYYPLCMCVCMNVWLCQKQSQLEQKWLLKRFTNKTKSPSTKRLNNNNNSQNNNAEQLFLKVFLENNFHLLHSWCVCVCLGSGLCLAWTNKKRKNETKQYKYSQCSACMNHCRHIYICVFLQRALFLTSHLGLRCTF